ncbi:MAG TPA: glucosaminidase domain-containing protein [Candidatus Colwellbacteria bacterium]|nr:glucosaminidase domain-containing protein [Candidatus Colwellbacteria bacterium]
MKLSKRIAVDSVVAVILILLFGLAHQVDAPKISPDLVCDLGTGKIEKSIPEDTRAARIDAYFSNRKMPAAGLGSVFIAAADRYEIDWSLLPAIAVVESSGGLHACGNNLFGWASCRPGIGEFESIESAIDFVAKNLGGKNPKTARIYGGNIDSDLWAYNGSVNPEYPGKVKKIMGDIERTPLPR